MFSEGMTAFQRSCRPRGKCARVEAAEFPNNSFMTSIMDSGKNSRVSRKLKKRQYTRWCFSAIYAELNEVHIYMRALIMNLTSTMTNCSTDNHMLLNVKYYSTLHVAWGKEKQLSLWKFRHKFFSSLQSYTGKQGKCWSKFIELIQHFPMWGSGITQWRLCIRGKLADIGRLAAGPSRL